MSKDSYRIHTKNGKIKYAGTEKDSWFVSREQAIADCDYSKGEKVYWYINCVKFAEAM